MSAQGRGGWLESLPQISPQISRAVDRGALAIKPCSPRSDTYEMDKWRETLVNVLTGVLWLMLLEAAVAQSLGQPVPHVSVPSLIVVVTLVASSALLKFPLRFGNQALLLGWTPTAFGLAVVALPVVYVAPVIALSYAGGMAARHLSLDKIAYRSAAHGVAAEMALTTLLALRFVFGVTLSRGAEVVIATTIFGLITTALALVSIAVTGRLDYLGVVRRAFPTIALFLTGNLMASLIASKAWRTSHWLLLVLAPFLVGMHVLYRAKFAVEEDRVSWNHLVAATDNVPELDEHRVLKEACARGTQLFHVRAAEVIVGPERKGRHFWLNDDDVLEPTRCPYATASSIKRPLVAAGKTLGWVLLHGPVSGHHTPTDDAQVEAYCHWLAAALEQIELHDALQAAGVEAAQRVFVDQLTGRPNRLGLEQIIDKRAEVNTEGLSGLVVCELLAWSAVGCVLGAAACDQLLITLAGRLQEGATDGVVARLEGSQLAVFFPDANDRSMHTQVAALRETLSDLRVTTPAHIGFEVACGIAMLGQDAGTAAELLRMAEVAVEVARAHPTLTARYCPAVDPRTNATPDRTTRDATQGGDLEGTAERNLEGNLQLLPRFRRALREGHIRLSYRSRHRPGDHAIVGAEVMVSWQDPSQGVIPQALWVPMVKQSGVVLRDATRLVLREATRTAAGWPSPLTVVVPIAPRSLCDERLPTDVEEALSRARLPGWRLTCQISEVAVADGVPGVLNVLDQLRALGVNLALGDFGAGGSSLSILTSIKVDEIKLSQTLVSELGNPGHHTVMKASVFMARRLGVRTVACGVSSAAHAQTLAEMGCDHLQGPLYSSDVSAEAMNLRIAEGPIAQVVSSRSKKAALSGGTRR